MPRVLPGSGSVDLSIELFGERLALPLIVGPTGLNGIFWRRADVLLARAAGGAGAAFTLSTASNSSLEDVAAAGAGVKWFQLYPWGERSLSQRLLERAAAAGYRALVVTVDTLTIGRRERDLRNDFAHEVRYMPRIVLDGLRHPRWLVGVWLRAGVPRFENIVEFAPKNASARDLTAFVRARRNLALSWDDLAWLRSRWRGPFLIKGVLAVEDAERAADMGADGLVVLVGGWISTKRPSTFAMTCTALYPWLGCFRQPGGFRKRSSKARRASAGRTEPGEASRSTATRSENCGQSLAARLSGSRSGIGWAHSNRRPGSKWLHCLQACTGALHCGQRPRGSVPGPSGVPHSAQRDTARCASTGPLAGPGGRGRSPFAPLSPPES